MVPGATLYSALPLVRGGNALLAPEGRRSLRRTSGASNAFVSVPGAKLSTASPLATFGRPIRGEIPGDSPAPTTTRYAPAFSTYCLRVNTIMPAIKSASVAATSTISAVSPETGGFVPPSSMGKSASWARSRIRQRT